MPVQSQSRLHPSLLDSLELDTQTCYVVAINAETRYLYSNEEIVMLIYLVVGGGGCYL